MNEARNAAFHTLNTYKHVDSAGRLFNNIGPVIFAGLGGGGKGGDSNGGATDKGGNGTVNLGGGAGAGGNGGGNGGSGIVIIRYLI